MRYGRWITAAAVGVALFAAAWLALRGRGMPMPPPDAHVDSAMPFAPPQSPRSRPGGPVASDPSGVLEIPPAKREEIASCLERNPRSLVGSARELRTLDELLLQLGGERAETQVLFRNIHVRRSDGTILRLHVAPGEPDAGRRVRVFSVDAEGLPVPEPLPPYLSGLSPEDAAARFREQGSVVFENRRLRERMGSDLAANVTEENGRTVEMQVFFSGHSLGCAWSDVGKASAPNLECRCL